MRDVVFRSSSASRPSNSSNSPAVLSADAYENDNDVIIKNIVDNNWTSIRAVPRSEMTIFFTFWRQDDSTILRQLAMLKTDERRKLFVNRQTVAMTILSSSKYSVLDEEDKLRLRSLIVVISETYPDLVRSIIEPTVLSIDGRSPAHWPVIEYAVHANNIAVLDAFFKLDPYLIHKQYVTNENAESRTVLHYAASSRYDVREATKHLVQLGADPCAINNYMETPIEYASNRYDLRGNNVLALLETARDNSHAFLTLGFGFGSLLTNKYAKEKDVVQDHVFTRLKAEILELRNFTRPDTSSSSASADEEWKTWINWEFAEGYQTRINTLNAWESRANAIHKVLVSVNESEIMKKLDEGHRKDYRDFYSMPCKWPWAKFRPSVSL